MIYVQTLAAPPICHREALRYAGVRGQDAEAERLLADCYRVLADKLSYRVCYGTFPVVRTKDGCLQIGTLSVNSRTVTEHLAGCDRVIVFAATVGVEADRVISRLAVTSPAKACLADAAATERIESLCDAFCAWLATDKSEAGSTLRRRFSPGYGDFPLEAQREIFGMLDCAKQIGLSLNQSLLMSPSKSVTALMGVESSHANQGLADRSQA